MIWTALLCKRDKHCGSRSVCKETACGFWFGSAGIGVWNGIQRGFLKYGIPKLKNKRNKNTSVGKRKKITENQKKAVKTDVFSAANRQVNKKEKHSRIASAFCMAGVEGFEPSNNGARNRGLTAWRYPIDL